MPMIYSESQFIQNASDELKTVRFPELCMRSDSDVFSRVAYVDVRAASVVDSIGVVYCMRMLYIERSSNLVMGMT